MPSLWAWLALDLAGCGTEDSKDTTAAADAGCVENACGARGALPAEVCDGADDDCDGREDEGVLNACGERGPAPAEVCNATDDDCDGAVDEGLPVNACGGCDQVESSARVELSHLDLRRVVGGAGGPGEAQGDPGASYGVYLVADDFATLRNVLAATFASTGAAVRFNGAIRVGQVANLTATDGGAGVQVDEANLDLVVVRDSIFSRLSGPAVASSPGNPAVELSYSAFDRIGEPPVSGDVTIDVGTMIIGERCLDPFSEALQLDPDSRCVDAGSPNADCSLEPGGDACDLDFGHLGNTPLARDRPD